jgi:hypothetical protein
VGALPFQTPKLAVSLGVPGPFRPFAVSIRHFGMHAFYMAKNTEMEV